MSHQQFARPVIESIQIFYWQCVAFTVTIPKSVYSRSALFHK